MFPPKHRHESVMWVDERAWLDKHVDFVKEEDGPLMMSKAKDGRQLLFKHLRVLAEFPGGYLKKSEGSDKRGRVKLTA